MNLSLLSRTSLSTQILVDYVSGKQRVRRMATVSSGEHRIISAGQTSTGLTVDNIGIRLNLRFQLKNFAISMAGRPQKLL